MIYILHWYPWLKDADSEYVKVGVGNGGVFLTLN
jgi:hypothetical protein